MRILKKRLQKSAALILSAAVFLGSVGLRSQAAEGETVKATYRGDILAAINTSTSASGSFSASSKEAKGTPAEKSDAWEGIWDTYVEPETGQVFYKRVPELPEPSSEPETDALPKAAAQYQVGGKATFSGSEYECLYVGDHCTVWRSSSGLDGINRISSAIAAEIGGKFDGQYADVSHAFGSDWNDKDGDGRVAILCYDIDNSYSKGQTGSPYTAGYYSSSGIDCIHIDTYPGMGLSLNDVPECYSTLFHEYQHMLNDYYDGRAGSDMPHYLNEAFSMAAEHLVCGPDSTANRTAFFSGSDYSPGTSLFNWSNDLSHYAIGYLFGQYLRVRYGQLAGGGDGSGIYSAVQNRRVSEKKSAVTVIEELLDTTMAQLMTDFWQAVALRETTGVHGFNGETWATRIDITGQIYGTISGNQSVSAGGAKYYALSGSFTPKSQNNVTLVAMQEPPIPTGSSFAVSWTAEDTAQVSLTPSCGGYIRYMMGDTAATDPALLEKTSVLKTGETLTLTFPELENRDHVLSYQMVSSTGKQGTLLTAEIPGEKAKASWSCAGDGTVSGSLQIPGKDETMFSLKLPSGTENSGSLLLAFYDKTTGRMRKVGTGAVTAGAGELKINVGTLDPADCTVKLLLVNGSFLPADSCVTIS